MGAVDYFLKIDGVEGETQDSMHHGDLEIETWGWGEVQSGTSMYGSGSGTGRISMRDFTFTKRVDKSTPLLFQACCSGKHFAHATFTARKAAEGGPQEYLKIYFDQVIISHFQTIGSAQTDIVPRDQISFNYERVQMEYRTQKPDGSLGGSVKEGYDLKQTMRV